MSAKRSRRIRSIEAMVPNCAALADVGCDHAYVSIDLVSEGRAKTAIASDVREGPLEIAASNIRAAGLDDRISLRCVDGLAGYRPGEVDAIVIAGMGGHLMRRILEEGAEVAAQAGTLVLEPQSEVPLIRAWIAAARSARGWFRIEREELVCEDGKYYPILRAVQSEMQEPIPEGPARAFGADLLERQDPTLFAYLNKRSAELARVSAALTDRHETDGGCRITGRLDAIRKEQWLVEAARNYYERNGTDQRT